MPALDLIRPSVTAMRVIASVNAEFARELKLPPHIRSLGLKWYMVARCMRALHTARHRLPVRC